MGQRLLLCDSKDDAVFTVTAPGPTGAGHLGAQELSTVGKKSGAGFESGSSS